MESHCADVTRVPPVHPLISRSTILILAVTLVAMGVGAHLPTDRAGNCLIWGSYGLLAYLVLEVTAKYRYWRKYFETREKSGHKLDQWVTTDLAIRSMGHERLGDSARRSIETWLPSHRHLLVIDDDREISKLVRSLLDSLKIRVLCCSQSAEAIELSRNAAAILCEANLLEAPGTDLIRELRRSGYRGPVIMMSGDSTRATIDASIVAGIDDFLIKPFSPETLFCRLRRLVVARPDSQPPVRREKTA